MFEQFNTRKLTMQDLVDSSQYNNSHSKGFSYSIENNQKNTPIHKKLNHDE